MSELPISLNMDDARKKHRDHLRQRRVDSFKKNDVAFRKALEDFLLSQPYELPVALLQAISEGKKLRNITSDNRIENASTIEELRAHQPI